MLIVLAVQLAMADPTTGIRNERGFYDEASIAGASELFHTANDIATTYQDAAAHTGAMADALTRYGEALDLLGDDASPTERQRLTTLLSQFARERAVLQGFVTGLTTDFDETFRAAMERAVARYPGTATRCEAQVARGRALPGMPSHTVANPDCIGDNLNAAIAAQMDEDPTLNAGVQALLSRPWPTITVHAASQPPVAFTLAEAQSSVDVAAFAHATIGGPLRDIDHADEEARLTIEAALEGGAAASELPTLRAQAGELSAQTATLRAGVFAPVRAAAERTLTKRHKRGGVAVGWCANPAYLGGCTVPGLDGDAVGALAEDPRVGKAARRAR